MSAALDGRVALVTGSSAGLGLAIGSALARAGCRVMLHGQEAVAMLQQARAALCAESGRDIGYIQADIAADDGVKALIDGTEAAFGRIDILVNNAVTRHFAPIESFPLDRWRDALAVNLTAPFHATQLVLPGMRAAGWGRIVNMASVYGQRGAVGRPGYVTTKAAIIGLTHATAAETASEPITCNAVCPGSVSTPGTEVRVAALMARHGLDRATAVRRFLEGKQPSGRFVAADSVAATVAFLCGPAGDDITGAVLPVEGGWLAT